jgi:hypothetical protein
MDAHNAPVIKDHQALVPTLIGIGLVVALVSSLGAPLIPTIALEHGVRLATADWILTAALLTFCPSLPFATREYIEARCSPHFLFCMFTLSIKTTFFVVLLMSTLRLTAATSASVHLTLVPPAHSTLLILIQGDTLFLFLVSTMHCGISTSTRMSGFLSASDIIHQ